MTTTVKIVAFDHPNPSYSVVALRVRSADVDGAMAALFAVGYRAANTFAVAGPPDSF